ncbi:MAG: hypothetical protein NTZ14_10290 [Hyphomicrobiales bacterium]|nr:hypothetical protein [Hyphomicrobiales bacterium]
MILTWMRRLGAATGLAFGLCGAALAQSPQPRTAPQPTYVPIREAMTFRIAEGQGPRGATRWVSATGQIQGNTASQFDAFRKANKIEGLPLVLDSTGGRVFTAMALGRMVRSLRMPTTVGRTISEGSGDGVRSKDVSCASACVLVLMGGIGRSVPDDARIDVHMFSVELDTEGNKARADPTFRDIEQSQRGMARHAVYLSEMGIGARYLEIMTEASFKGAMRRMTRDEITQTQLAMVTERELNAPRLTGWSISSSGAPPQLIRSALLSETAQMSVDHELVVECDNVRGFYWTTYRQQLRRLEGERQQGQPVSLTAARLETGGWNFVFQFPPRGLGINAVGNDLWLRRPMPQKVLEDAVANGRLDVLIGSPGRQPQTASLYDPSLARLLPDFIRRCEARPGLVSVGPTPRR